MNNDRLQVIEYLKKTCDIIIAITSSSEDINLITELNLAKETISKAISLLENNDNNHKEITSEIIEFLGKIFTIERLSDFF